MVFMQVRVEISDDFNKLAVDTVVKLQAKESELIEQLGRMPILGDRVSIDYDTSGSHSKILSILQINPDSIK
jgi:hypothetical protein